MHRKCSLSRMQQLPLCWLTILHQVLMKRQSFNIMLVNFRYFLNAINDKNSSCGLSLFSTTVWKMMDEIMSICHQHLIVEIEIVLLFKKKLFSFSFLKVENRSTTKIRDMYDDCLYILEDMANRLCCLPHRMITHLFDIKRLISIRVWNIKSLFALYKFFSFCRLIIREHHFVYK